MHILTTNFDGNPNIGLYAFATDEYCLIGFHLKRREREAIEQVLKVPVYTVSVCGTPLIGVFCAGNSKCLLVPGIIFKDELEELKKLKINVHTVSTRHTALGNNILCSENGCIINPEFEPEARKKIADALGMKVIAAKIADIDTVGSAAVTNSTHCIVHRDANNHDLNLIKTTLKVEVETGTINMANPYLRAGIVCNDNGFIIGDQSGGPEIVNVDEVLGYLGRKE